MEQSELNDLVYKYSHKRALLDLFYTSDIEYSVDGFKWESKFDEEMIWMRFKKSWGSDGKILIKDFEKVVGSKIKNS